jgi:hypothetical protein
MFLHFKEYLGQKEWVTLEFVLRTEVAYKDKLIPRFWIRMVHQRDTVETGPG